jgi:glucan phosphoethanolaminetransferase (alkaline phosphatase superfamily)
MRLTGWQVWGAAVLQILLVLAVVAATNIEVPARFALLLSQGRLGALAITGSLWVVALVALITILLEQKLSYRVAWAVFIAVCGSVAYGFQDAAKLELSVFDILGFWEARHETGHAAEIYGPSFIKAGAFAIFSALVFAAPFASRAVQWMSWSRVRRAVPLLPVVMIAAVVFLKGGNGHYAMPKQFSQASLAALVVGKLTFNPTPEHMPVQQAAVVDHTAEKILYLVDESLRPDFISAQIGNNTTPGFAQVASRMVNYGQAASASICSNTSNAILRFMATRADLGGPINANSTIWQFAKAAGYRTVYIDAQAHAISNETRLQNFMTEIERKSIDAFYPLVDETAATADMALLEIVERELKSPGKVFIYANKQGMHFPYDAVYDATHAIYHPTITEAGGKTFESNLNSYRNGVAWNVDRFFAAFAKRIDMSNLNMVYTSDHGQLLDPHDATHCKFSGHSPEMALVPLFAYSSNATSQSALALGASKSVGFANHFQIAPTLLEWMGFRDLDSKWARSESLTRGSSTPPMFSVGDIFGLFSSDIEWAPIDLKRTYAVEPATQVSAMQKVAQ